jgi:LacI family transcriptional regulator
MRAIGRLGAEHLLERNFRRFAFCGFTETWSAMRRDGFVETVGGAAAGCDVYESPWHGRNVPEWDEDQERMARWIHTLPKPLGLMACNDVRGQQVLNACRAVDVAVPDEVAVVGVDNEEVLCELCDPPLSSVTPNPERIGYDAAELLDRLMSDGTEVVEERLIPPLGVIMRQSSDVLGIDDPDVAAAVRHIREDACNGLTVDELVGRLSVSRSLLERRFRRCLRRSPQQEIRLMQLKRVRQLLNETDLTLDAIARLAGYEHPEYMSVVFKRLTGQTPGEYREQVRSNAR